MDMNARLLGLYAKKDINSIITDCDEMFLHYSGAKSKDDVVGHTDFEFVWQEYAFLYRQHEIEVMDGNEYSAIIPIKDAKKSTLLFLHNKIRTINEKGKTNGLIVHAVEILNPDYHRLISTLTRINTKKNIILALEKNVQNIKLSARQKQCLFFLVYGKSAKIIARILNISHRTVETHIETLKVKFGCHSKSDLIDTAIDLGFLDVIPLFCTPQKMAKALAE